MQWKIILLLWWQFCSQVYAILKLYLDFFLTLINNNSGIHVLSACLASKLFKECVMKSNKKEYISSFITYIFFSNGGNNSDTSFNMTTGTSGSSNEVKNAYFTNRCQLYGFIASLKLKWFHLLDQKLFRILNWSLEYYTRLKKIVIFSTESTEATG